MDKFINLDASCIINRLNEKNQQFKDKTILITGAFGFLGQQFLHYFVKLCKTITMYQKFLD